VRGCSSPATWCSRSLWATCSTTQRWDTRPDLARWGWGPLTLIAGIAGSSAVLVAVAIAESTQAAAVAPVDRR